MDLGLNGKVAIVTGGSDGIGKATAIELAREGARVAICARRPAPVAQTVEELKRIGPDAWGMVADVTQPRDIEKFIDAVAQYFGRIDILVNNAGASARGPFLEIGDEAWQSDIELKLYGAIRCTRLVIPHLRKQGGGRVINITISGAKQPGANSMPTSISRAAGLALTKALSKELAPDNILVNTVCIGKIKSGQHQRHAADAGVTEEKYYSTAAKEIPLRRVGEAQEAAKVIVFLASEAASYVTGTSINLDGGMSGVL